MNTKLLRRIAKIILKRPTQFDMNLWFRKSSNVAECGTAACIAGWALTIDLQGRDKKKLQPLLAAKTIESKFGEGMNTRIGSYHNQDMIDKGAAILGLNEEQARKLFMVNEWPHRYYTRYANAITAQEKAKAAADYIGYFIEQWA